MTTRRKSNNSLHPSQKKMILDFLGMSVNDLPQSVKEIDGLLEAQQRRNPEEYKKAFNIIVNKEFDNAPPNKVINFNDAVRIVRDEIDSQERQAIKVISDKYSGLTDEVVSSVRKENDSVRKLAENVIAESREEIKKQIAIESKKFNRIEIKVGSKKAKEVTGALPEQFERLLQLASSRINILMVGPTGCGKTFIASKIAEALDLDFSSQSCSAGVSESAFTGWLIPIGASGRFVYVQSEFVRMYENGGVFLFDEMDASDPNVLVFLNQALANKQFTLPQRYENPIVKKHKDFVAIGAANTNGSGANSMYHGRNALDEATLDRFRVGTVNMEYSVAVETSIIQKNVYDVCMSIRNAIAAKKLQRVMSTRTMLDIQEMHNTHEWKISQCLEGYLASWSREEIKMIADAGAMLWA